MRRNYVLKEVKVNISDNTLIKTLLEFFDDQQEIDDQNRKRTDDLDRYNRHTTQKRKNTGSQYGPRERC